MKSRTKKVLAAVAIVAGLVGVGVWNASQSQAEPAAMAAAVKPDCTHPPTVWPLCPRSVGNPQLVDNAVTENKLSAAVRAKLNAAGTPGQNGKDAILTVTADTMVTGRDDTATDASVWAKDAMTRTLTVVRQSAAEASKCGAGAVKCWFYTGTIKDNGTFQTVAGAHGPNSTTPINGIVQGTVNGVYEIEFYANSDVPNSSNVDSTVTGNSPSTSNWMKMAFPAGTQFDGFHGVDYKWSYAAAATCENHVQQTSGNTGDILGVNHC